MVENLLKPEITLFSYQKQIGTFHKHKLTGKVNFKNLVNWSFKKHVENCRYHGIMKTESTTTMGGFWWDFKTSLTWERKKVSIVFHCF